MPLVSVIIPNYNHAPFLKQRIDSVLNQTLQDFEVIILDDCSTDDSREVIEEYRNDPKIAHIIFNETNSGSTFKQWKKGIELAQGEWIWIAESDDWCEAVFLENVLEATNVNHDTVISYAQTYIINEVAKSCYANYDGEKIFYSLDGNSFVEKKMLPYNGIWNASQAIFQKKYYYCVSAEYLKYKFCGDWIFWIELSLMGNVAICGKFTSYFRKHENDVTSGVTKSGKRYFEELDALNYFDILLNKNEHLKKHNIYYTHFYKLCFERNCISKQDFRKLKEKYLNKLSFQQKAKIRLVSFVNYLKGYSK